MNSKLANTRKLTIWDNMDLAKKYPNLLKRMRFFLVINNYNKYRKYDNLLKGFGGTVVQFVDPQVSYVLVDDQKLAQFNKDQMNSCADKNDGNHVSNTETDKNADDMNKSVSSNVMSSVKKSNKPKTKRTSRGRMMVDKVHDDVNQIPEYANPLADAKKLGVKIVSLKSFESWILKALQSTHESVKRSERPLKKKFVKLEFDDYGVDYKETSKSPYSHFEPRISRIGSKKELRGYCEVCDTYYENFAEHAEDPKHMDIMTFLGFDKPVCEIFDPLLKEYSDKLLIQQKTEEGEKLERQKLVDVELENNNEVLLMDTRKCEAVSFDNKRIANNGSPTAATVNTEVAQVAINEELLPEQVQMEIVAPAENNNIGT